MPIYEFDCGQCGMRFERMKPLSKSGEGDTCPECGTPAHKVMSAVNHTFAHTPVGGPRPQNTGVHAIDYSADRVIGRDAEAKWKVIGERDARKNSVIRDEKRAGRNLTRDQLVRTPEGDYRPITESERVATNQGRAVLKTPAPQGATGES